jgi:hypothetical protein
MRLMGIGQQTLPGSIRPPGSRSQETEEFSFSEFSPPDRDTFLVLGGGSARAGAFPAIFRRYPGTPRIV